jgi:hypothetical protein
LNRLRGIEVNYLTNQKVWETQKKRLDEEVSGIKKIQEESTALQTTIDGLKKQIGEKEGLRKEADGQY